MQIVGTIDLAVGEISITTDDIDDSIRQYCGRLLLFMMQNLIAAMLVYQSRIASRSLLESGGITGKIFF